jgi:hypothetical protein
MEMITLKKLNDVERKQLYCAEISNRFVASKNSENEEDINRAPEIIKENIRVLVKENLA